MKPHESSQSDKRSLLLGFFWKGLLTFKSNIPHLSNLTITETSVECLFNRKWLIWHRNSFIHFCLVNSYWSCLQLLICLQMQQENLVLQIFYKGKTTTDELFCPSGIAPGEKWLYSERIRGQFSWALTPWKPRPKINVMEGTRPALLGFYFPDPQSHKHWGTGNLSCRSSRPQFTSHLKQTSV